MVSWSRMWPHSFVASLQALTPKAGVVLDGSSRRVKRGPGRRPQSAKRARFAELRARGWGLVVVAKEIGISRSTAKNWHRGNKRYKNGKVVGFTPPLDRL